MKIHATLRSAIVIASFAVCLTLTGCGGGESGAAGTPSIPVASGPGAGPVPGPGPFVPAPAPAPVEPGPAPVPVEPPPTPVPVEPAPAPAPVEPPPAPPPVEPPPVPGPVDPAPAPPPPLTISGTPNGAATVGTAWRFQPQANADKSASLRWQVENMPAWTSFNSATGALEGTPSAAHVGTFKGVVIRVTDGAGTAALPEFTVEVIARAGAHGSAELSWTPPTERTDGTPVGALAGYRILYGTASGKYDQAIEIDNPGVTQYLVEHLAPGKWYFALTAISADELESEPSREVNKTHGG